MVARGLLAVLHLRQVARGEPQEGLQLLLLVGGPQHVEALAGELGQTGARFFGQRGIEPFGDLAVDPLASTV